MKRTVVSAALIGFGFVSTMSLTACGADNNQPTTGSVQASSAASEPTPSQSANELQQQVSDAMAGKCSKYLDGVAPPELKDASANEKRAYEFARTFCLEQFASEGERGEGVHQNPLTDAEQKARDAAGSGQEPTESKTPERKSESSLSSTSFDELDRSLPMPGDVPTLEPMPEAPDADGHAKPRTLEFQIPPGCEKEYLQRDKELAGQQMG